MHVDLLVLWILLLFHWCAGRLLAADVANRHDLGLRAWCNPRTCVSSRSCSHVFQRRIY